MVYIEIKHNNKRNQLVSMSATTLERVYNESRDINNNNNNNNLCENDKCTCKKELCQNQIRNKLLTKLGKINISKSTGNTDVKTKSKDESKDESKDDSKKFRDKSTEYYYKHREEKLEYQKNYNRQKGDAIKDYNKNYYMKRREEILEKARTKVTCECGCIVQLFNMNSHKKTKKHIRYLEMRKAMTSAVMATTTS